MRQIRTSPRECLCINIRIGHSHVGQFRGRLTTRSPVDNRTPTRRSGAGSCRVAGSSAARRAGRSVHACSGRVGRLFRCSAGHPGLSARVMYGPPWSAPRAAAAGAAQPGSPARRQAGRAGPARTATPASSWTRRETVVLRHQGPGLRSRGVPPEGRRSPTRYGGMSASRLSYHVLRKRNLAFKFDHGICIAIYRRRHFLRCPACHVGTPHQH
jgi:hypothetical protein